ncbi:cupin domain-containing protein [Bifidobacterium choloepi]|uniref:Cupin domain-containing protein n=1 Tax=Bifidobacterium choloepi TaxID=2614131 RepID=A0A6I5NKH8_9BIFI|nr:cupin domain-containing protein [Bifidobacterium choloepi]NEG69352.1 cupin domain-containing protein [Bifidobacterium choloepi]
MSRTTPLGESVVVTDVFADLPIVKESTTSRVLVNNERLRHVMFSMDAGQVLTEHTSARAVIVNMLTGALKFSVAGVPATVRAGDVIYLAPDELHAVEAIEPSYFSLTLVVPGDLPAGNPDTHGTAVHND